MSASDPTTLFIVGLMFMGVSMMACWYPVRRAMTVDPMVALRHE